jgi:hypothetical protein
MELNKLTRRCPDHIFPVSAGFKYGVPPSVMSNISNLQILKKVENLKKSAIIGVIPDIIKSYIKE